MNYLETDLLAIAKRDNNKKRSYILVNPLQGKHLPVAPYQTFTLIKELAGKVFSRYHTDNILIIGFAETATAIGAILAANAPFDVKYIHTTREPIEGANFLFFSEEHSHATEQKLVKDFLDESLTDDSLIIFAEDEVTTGRTVENIISVLRKTYPKLHLKFGIASILNGMSADKINALSENHIQCDFILPVPTYDYETLLHGYDYHEDTPTAPVYDLDLIGAEIAIDNYIDPRKGIYIQEYLKRCDLFSQQILDSFDLSKFNNKRVLVLGTEECMYPGLHFGHQLEACVDGVSVFFHAATRSPILPSINEGYPIHCRYRLNSFYDDNRTTYIYNLSCYDYVFVITDSSADTTGFTTLLDALRKNRCRNITKIVWRQG